MWYWIFRIAFIVIFRSFLRLKVEGLENLPKKNFIGVANHTSFLDPLAIVAATPKKIHCLAAWYLYRICLVRWFLQRIEALPTGFSSERALYLLEKDQNVGLFPEGGCSRDGKLGKFRTGAIVLAIKTGRPIVPFAVFGTHEALPLEAKFPKFVPIKVKIGKPIYFLKEFADFIDDIRLQEGILKVRNTIKEMLDAG